MLAPFTPVRMVMTLLLVLGCARCLAQATEAPDDGPSLEFRTAAEPLDVFADGQEIVLRFMPRNVPDDAITGFQYKVVDYEGRQRWAGAVLWLPGRARRLYRETPDPLPTGYYEVRAWWQRGTTGMDSNSCIAAEGSVPDGVGTFAVLPPAGSAPTHSAGFFGLHGAPRRLRTLAGCPGSLDLARWVLHEPRSRPERVDGTAPWTAAALTTPPASVPAPVLVFRLAKTDIPVWARRPGSALPRWTHWTDVENFIGDRVRVHAHAYPASSRRECTLDFHAAPPADAQDAPANAAMLVDHYARFTTVIRSADAGVRILATSGLHRGETLERWDALMGCGLLQHVDGLALRPYHTGQPEAAGLVELVRGLGERMEATLGRRLPVRAIDWGRLTAAEDANDYRTAAQCLLRANLMLQGEGLTGSLPGPVADGGAAEGLCFNPELSWRPAQPSRLAPKPALVALAVQSGILRGATPVRSFSVPGRGIWGYVFARAGQDGRKRPVHVIWTTGERKKVRLSMGTVETVTVVNMMGARADHTVMDGKIQLHIGPAPQYIIGAKTR